MMMMKAHLFNQACIGLPLRLIYLLTYRASHLTTVSSRFAETRFDKIRVRGRCLPDSPKPVSPKLGFRVGV